MKDNDNQIIELTIPLTKVISIKIDAETLNETDIIFKKKGFRSRSELIREAIDIYVELLKRYDREELKKELIREAIDIYVELLKRYDREELKKVLTLLLSDDIHSIREKINALQLLSK